MKTEIKTNKYFTLLSANLPIVWLGSEGDTNYWGLHTSRAVFGNGFIRDERDDCLNLGDHELTGWELIRAIDCVRSIRPSKALVEAIEAFTDCEVKKQYNQYALCWRCRDGNGVEQPRYAPEYGEYRPFSDILLAFLIGGKELEHIQS